jgi:hypothetical protein
MKHRKFTILLLIVSLIFWLTDSLLHAYVYAEGTFELIPTDFDELWMRIVIILLLIVIGVVGDSLANRIDTAEREKREVFLVAISSTQHVMTNLLSQMQVVFLETSKTDKLSGETRNLMEQWMREGKDQIDRLSSVAKIEEEAIKKSVRSN